jgi:hypothetical protein
MLMRLATVFSGLEMICTGAAPISGIASRNCAWGGIDGITPQISQTQRTWLPRMIATATQPQIRTRSRGFGRRTTSTTMAASHSARKLSA